LQYPLSHLEWAYRPAHTGRRRRQVHIELLQLKVKCPTCKRQIEWSDAAPFKPFCSERCKLIDLGAWLSEKHAIPGDAPADADSSGETPTGI
jgi:Uncharacterized protein conserved in bacteria